MVPQKSGESEWYHKNPVSESGTAKRPVSESGTAKRPVSESGTAKRPVSESGTAKRPVSRSGEVCPGRAQGQGRQSPCVNFRSNRQDGRVYRPFYHDRPSLFWFGLCVSCCLYCVWLLLLLLLLLFGEGKGLYIPTTTTKTS